MALTWRQAGRDRGGGGEAGGAGGAVCQRGAWAVLGLSTTANSVCQQQCCSARRADSEGLEGHAGQKQSHVGGQKAAASGGQGLGLPPLQSATGWRHPQSPPACRLPGHPSARSQRRCNSGHSTQHAEGQRLFQSVTCPVGDTSAAPAPASAPASTTVAAAHRGTEAAVSQAGRQAARTHLKKARSSSTNMATK